MSLEERLKRSLLKRELEGNLRKLKTERSAVDFFSNDYLGLARNKELQERIDKRYHNLGDKISGATGSRLLSGNTDYYQELEGKLAKIFMGESSLIFNSGYTANLAVFSSIPQKGDTIIYDELIHACIKEGSRLNFADRFSFKHNDLSDLENKLKRAKGEKFIAVETIYSMDGDAAPLQEIVELARAYDANIIIDEAHGTGVYGNAGSGKACEQHLQEDIFIRVYTFGKAIGSHGACVVGSKTMTDYLVNFSRSFIYTTALPLHNLISIEEAFDLIADKRELQETMRRRIDVYRQKIVEAKKENPSIDFIDSSSPIQAVVVPGNVRAKALSSVLNEHGFDVRPILSPTVQEGKERVRVCLHAYNTPEEIEGLVQAIKTFEF